MVSGNYKETKQIEMTDERVKNIIKEEREKRWENIFVYFKITVIIGFIVIIFIGIPLWLVGDYIYSDGYSKGYETGINNQSLFIGMDTNYSIYEINYTYTSYCSDYCALWLNVHNNDKFDYTKDSTIRILNLSEENCKRCE